MSVYPNLIAHDSTALKNRWDNLYGASMPAAISNWLDQNQEKTKLIVAPNQHTAESLLDAIRFFQNHASITDQVIPNIVQFPGWETLPYDKFSPHQDIVSERLNILHALDLGCSLTIVTSIQTLMHRICPADFIHQHVFSLKTGQKINLETVRLKLIKAGYHVVQTVLERGEFAIRGGIFDLFPMGSDTPFRIEQFDDVVETIRTFNPDTQKTIKTIPSIEILPAKECPLDDLSIKSFRESFRATFSSNPQASPIYEQISQGTFPQGIEYYLPLFFSEPAVLLDYLPDETQVCTVDDVQEQARIFWDEINTRYTELKDYPIQPALDPKEGFISPDSLLNRLNHYVPQRIQSTKTNAKAHTTTYNTIKPPNLAVDHKADNPCWRITQYIEHNPFRIIFLIESTGRRETLKSILERSGIKAQNCESWLQCIESNSAYCIAIAPIHVGVLLPESNCLLLTEYELFGTQSTPQQRKKSKHSIQSDAVIKNLAELSLGAPIVHIEYGVGRYLGLQTIDNQGTLSEFLILNYANEDKIYVPVTSLHLLSRYTGSDSDQAPLHRLGSEQWQKARKKAAEKIHDVACELLDIHAKRAAQPGFSHHFEQTAYQQFVSDFPFEETADQARAIKQVIEDMKAPHPMDRLICGDVGFGKTEVAMRAAFVAIHSGKQVCVLAPTTLLAGQHFETFQDRFCELPVQIALLSRFKTEKEIQKILHDLKSGQIDMVIGTHKLLQKSIQFKKLGLLIIDEEHRFGVKQKEQIKALRTDVDILSMTATPIPRTLNMAMAGIRDISLIATPPAKRLAIKTFWQEKSDRLIREAVLRETLRGGQVFYLHNNVQTIVRTAQSLQKLIPEAKIEIAHGQMRERELERIMSDFYHQRFNVLVCTTIIETGIDIPTANTIIMDRADQFGLAQIHQLRGRVGRSHHQAYAYLLTPNHEVLTKDAKKRLEAITSIEDLGAGFMLATHDLEIRGAGELLGEEQSGHMHAIGYTLYMDMLEETVQALKRGESVSEPFKLTAQGPEIELGISAIIPEDFIQDVQTRLSFYKRIAQVKQVNDLNELKVEMIDRFGLLPKPIDSLFEITELKLRAAPIGIKKVSASTQYLNIEFNPKANIDSNRLIQLIQSKPMLYRLDGPQKMKYKWPNDSNLHDRISTTFELIRQIT